MQAYTEPNSLQAAVAKRKSLSMSCCCNITDIRTKPDLLGTSVEHYRSNLSVNPYKKHKAHFAVSRCSLRKSNTNTYLEKNSNLF
jgi:hypothetical protein